MKRIAHLLTFTLLVLATVYVLSACENESQRSATCQHQWSEANCIYPKTCRLCQTLEGTALGHNFSEATCTQPKTCQNCNHVEGESLGHTEVIDVSVEPTCATKGLTEGKHCSVCNNILIQQTEINTIEHAWTDATCQKPKTCSKCQATEGQPLSDHNYKNGKCIYCKQTDPKDKEFEAADATYFYLTIAHQLCTDVMDSIYGAWYFAIYEADDYLNAQRCLESFCTQANLDYDDTLVALNDVLEYMGYSNPTGTQQLAALRTFSIAVDVVVQTYINYGTYNSIDVNLSNAKTSLKSVTNNYSDYTGYPTLKSYYSEISAYAEFCKSPTGSFSQLKTTIDTYETNLRNYKNDLSFIFD